MKMIKRRLNWRFAWSALPPKVVQANLPPQCEVLFYTRSKRFADYLAPLRERLPGRSAYHLPAEAHGLQQELASLGIPFIAAASARTRHRSPQSVIGRYAPHLAFFADGVENALRRIKPRVILLPEGNSPDDEVVNQVGKKLGIPVACLQQGWSPILHPGFRNLDYAAFLVWGAGFADLFSQGNPKQTFTPVGNMALTFGFLPPAKRPPGVLFFHQDIDRGLGGRRGSDMMISLAEQIASQMPHIPVFYRPHPLVPLEEVVQKRFARFPNIVIQAPGECPLAKVLRQVCVSVSIYSTTILESAAAGVVPIIFNMTTMPRFWPDMSETGAAIETRTTEEALETLIRLLSDREFLASHTEAMRAFSDHFFYSRGNQAMGNILERLQQS